MQRRPLAQSRFTQKSHFTLRSETFETWMGTDNYWVAYSISKLMEEGKYAAVGACRERVN